MPVYEFECAKGHTVSDLVPIGTKVVVCPTCFEQMKAEPPAIPFDGDPVINAWNPLAERVLSPTPTTFEFADNRRKRDFNL